MAIKVTFKRHKKEGRFRSFQRTFVDVKVKRRCIGAITEQKNGEFRCAIMVKQPVTKEDPAGWRWLTLSAVFKTEQFARDFFTLRVDEIYAKFNVHELED